MNFQTLLDLLRHHNFQKASEDKSPRKHLNYQPTNQPTTPQPKTKALFLHFHSALACLPIQIFIKHGIV